MVAPHRVSGALPPSRSNAGIQAAKAIMAAFKRGENGGWDK